MRNVLNNLDEVSPHGLISLPRIWPLPHRLFTATADAAVVLSEEAALELVDNFGRDLSHRRDVCAKAAKRAGASALAGGWATYNTLAPTTILIEALAVKLARWDGHGSLPTLTSAHLGSWDRVPLPVSEHRDAYRSWRKVVKQEFLENLSE